MYIFKSLFIYIFTAIVCLKINKNYLEKTKSLSHQSVSMYLLF